MPLNHRSFFRCFHYCGLFFAATLLAACSSLNPFGGSDPQQMAELPAITPKAELRLAWSYQTGASKTAVFYPALAGGAVFVASENGNIARLENGKEIWKIEAGKPLLSGVGSDGRIVAVGTGDGDVLAFSATDGSPLWQQKASSDILMPPLVENGLVVVRSGDSRIVAFNQKGERQWVYQRTLPSLFLRTTTPMIMADQFVLTGFAGGKLVAISTANGLPLWEGTVATPKGATELDRIADVAAPPVLFGQLGCAVAFQGRLTCFNLGQDGNTVWSREISSSVGMGADHRGLYITDEQDIIHALSPDTGSSLWKQDKLRYRRLTAPLLVGNSYLAVGDIAGYIHLLSRDNGEFAARLNIDDSPIMGSLQFSGRQILAQTRSGRVIALEIP